MTIDFDMGWWPTTHVLIHAQVPTGGHLMHIGTKAATTFIDLVDMSGMNKPVWDWQWAST